MDINDFEKQVDRLVELYTSAEFVKKKVEVDHTELGDLVGMTNWVQYCEKCEMRADFRTTLTNDQNPDGYNKSGERYVYYCTKHLPERAKKFWDFNSNLKNWF